jgi:putative tryptophan/tyrosine transport system substrate-binding protein
MKRREFITLLGGAAAWPMAARAQQPAKLPTIGFLGATTPSAQSQWTAAFVERLRELGWIEGRNVAIEYRWMEGRNERVAEIAAEFVQLRVDVIVVQGTAEAPLAGAREGVADARYTGHVRHRSARSARSERAHAVGRREGP